MVANVVGMSGCSWMGGRLEMKRPLYCKVCGGEIVYERGKESVEYDTDSGEKIVSEEIKEGAEAYCRISYAHANYVFLNGEWEETNMIGELLEV